MPTVWQSFAVEEGSGDIPRLGLFTDGISGSEGRWFAGMQRIGDWLTIPDSDNRVGGSLDPLGKGSEVNRWNMFEILWRAKDGISNFDIARVEEDEYSVDVLADMGDLTSNAHDWPDRQRIRWRVLRWLDSGTTYEDDSMKAAVGEKNEQQRKSWRSSGEMSHLVGSSILHGSAPCVVVVFTLFCIHDMVSGLNIYNTGVTEHNNDIENKNIDVPSRVHPLLHAHKIEVIGFEL